MIKLTNSWPTSMGKTFLAFLYSIHGTRSTKLIGNKRNSILLQIGLNIFIISLFL